MSSIEHVITARSLGEAWIRSLHAVLTYGTPVHDNADSLLEVCGLYVKIFSISDQDPIIRKYANPDRIELMKLKYRSCDIIANYKVSYGKLLYDWMGVNQIEWVVNRLRYKPETKSATIALHPPGQEYLSCLSLLDFKIRNNGLNMTAVYRSQNIYGSQPGNIIALRKIQDYVASKVGVRSGEFNLIALSAHIYEPDLEAARQLVSLFPEYSSTSRVKHTKKSKTF